MKFSLFHKQKDQIEPEKQAAPVPPQEEPKENEEATALPEEPKQEPAAVSVVPVETTPAPTEQVPSQEITVPPQEEENKKEVTEPLSKTYLKAMPLKDVIDVESVKNEVKNGNIIILRVTPLANKSIEDVKKAINELYQFSESSGGDIARLGEERVVICPKNIRIWREKTPVHKDSMPTTSPTAA